MEVYVSDHRSFRVMSSVYKSQPFVFFFISLFSCCCFFWFFFKPFETRKKKGTLSASCLDTARNDGHDSAIWKGSSYWSTPLLQWLQLKHNNSRWIELAFWSVTLVRCSVMKRDGDEKAIIQKETPIMRRCTSARWNTIARSTLLLLFNGENAIVGTRSTSTGKENPKEKKKKKRKKEKGLRSIKNKRGDEMKKRSCSMCRAQVV